MIRRLFLSWIVSLLAAGAAMAFLPSDASEREPEIRAYREKVRADYEKRIEERQAVATKEYERATKAIGVPPWELDRVVDGDNSRQVQQMAVLQEQSSNAVKKQILVSIVLLILIGSGVAWVRKATRTDEE